MTLSFFVFLKPCPGKVLIAALAQVKDHVITTRETAIHEALIPVLNDSSENPKKTSSRDQVVREWLLFYEALEFYNQPVRVSEQTEKWKAVRRHVTRFGARKKFKIKDKELREKVRRTLEAKRLYDFKKKASNLPVSVIEVENEYRENRKNYKSTDEDKAKIRIRKNLEQKKLQKQKMCKQ